MKRILLAVLAFYKRWLSPALHSLGIGGCKFRPTCSEYAAEAITIHGAVRGSVLAAWRLLRCHPFSPGGFDPVPLPVPPWHAHPANSADSVPAASKTCHHEPLP